MKPQTAPEAIPQQARSRLARIKLAEDRIVAQLSLGPPGSQARTASFMALMQGFEDLSETAARLLQGGAGPVVEAQGGWLAAPGVGPFEAQALLVGEVGGLAVWQLSLCEGGHLAATATMKRSTEIAADEHADRAGFEELAGPGPDGRALREVKAQSNAERQRERIAEAAADIIARKGFAQATVREIADAAGLHVPTLYTYVASKDDLLELVYTTSMDRILVDVAAATANCSSAREKIGVAIHETLARIESNRRRIGVMNRELRSLPPPARARVLERYRVVLDQVADIVRAGVASGEFRPVDAFVAANIIDAICDMRALRPFSLGGYDRAAFAQEVLSFIDRGLAADKARA